MVMKKYIYIFLVGVAITLAGCGGQESPSAVQGQDSTSVQTDSLSNPVDSTKAPVQESEQL